MKKWLAGAAVAGLGSLLLWAAHRPAAFHVERSLHVDARPGQVTELLADLSRFDEWQPWRKYDLTMPVRIGGSPGVVGATYTWSGNADVGSGELALTAVVPGERVEAEVRSAAPWAGTCHLTWTVRDEGDGTIVTWGVDGQAASVMDRDAMIGKELNEGLWRLKHVAERRE